MTTTLRALASALDDDPWCGTRPPHWPPLPPRLGSLDDVMRAAELTGEIQAAGGIAPRSTMLAALQQQLRLFQVGQSLEGLRGAPAELGAQASALAMAAFDDTCGSVPLSVLIQWLLHHPVPPGPPPWLQEIEFAAQQVKLSSRMEGSTGAAVQQAALGMIRSQLAAFSEKQAR